MKHLLLLIAPLFSLSLLTVPPAHPVGLYQLQAVNGLPVSAALPSAEIIGGFLTVNGDHSATLVEEVAGTTSPVIRSGRWSVAGSSLVVSWADKKQSVVIISGPFAALKVPGENVLVQFHKQ